MRETLLLKRYAKRFDPDCAIGNHVIESTKMLLVFFGHGFLPQRFLAALAAIWERFFGLNAAARAAPPLSPPRRPNATAAGFLAFGGSVFGASPMDSRK